MLTLNMRFMKTHFFTLIIYCQQNINELVTRPGVRRLVVANVVNVVLFTVIRITSSLLLQLGAVFLIV